ncbi:MAG: TetR family transcriptional regulator [Actinomycetota bacterium]|nr:TetR family transcriptional regulator [Actinomycetota bacterium]
MRRRPGRRPGNSVARADILAAGGRAFAEHGYARATIRGVAREAGVDPALVHHYFGNKRQLFIEAMALPANPADLIEGLLSQGDPGDLGERMIRTMLAVWDDEERRAPVIALYRSAMSDDQAAAMIREFATIEILGRIVKAAAGDRQELRMNLLATQVFGLLSLRYIIKLEPLASADPEVVVATVGPTFQRYLTGSL